ncbi:MAG TPA: hypothetical protein P5556_00575 [Candidatus Gastranaerophilales bacterium]|nr:hypothetical protein [Candidatus Gastranaerophilales bacterium]
MLATLMFALLEFIIIAIGFGVGYWLITAATKEENWKKIVGAVFGWILIIYAVIIAGMICFQWINYMQTGRLPVEFQCPMMRQMMQQKQQMQPGQMPGRMRGGMMQNMPEQPEQSE